MCPCPTLTKIILCPPFQGILTVFDKLNSSIITVRQLDHSQTIISGGSPLTIPIPFSMVSAWCQLSWLRSVPSAGGGGFFFPWQLASVPVPGSASQGWVGASGRPQPALEMPTHMGWRCLVAWSNAIQTFSCVSRSGPAWHRLRKTQWAWEWCRSNIMSIVRASFRARKIRKPWHLHEYCGLLKASCLPNN